MENGKKPINALPSDVDSSKVECIGLTKREYFAAMAMQGLLTDYFNNGQYGNHVNYPMVSEIAVRCADDLLAELEK